MHNADSLNKNGDVEEEKQVVIQKQGKTKHLIVVIAAKLSCTRNTRCKALKLFKIEIHLHH